jgi:hypothetical protein
MGTYTADIARYRNMKEDELQTAIDGLGPNSPLWTIAFNELQKKREDRLHQQTRRAARIAALISGIGVAVGIAAFLYNICSHK